MCHQGAEDWVQGKIFLIPNTLYPISHHYIQLTLLFFPFGEFLLASQQNAKVENDWCETRLSKQRPLKTQKTSNNFECQGQ
jgi:hypothetical protein